MIIGILKEPQSDKRVAFLPPAVKRLVSLGVEIVIEKGAGEGAYSPDEEYLESGATVISGQDVLEKADIIATVNLPSGIPADSFRKGQILISLVNPVENRDWIEKAKEQGLTVIALDLLPRVTRAQAMDVLSSMATVAGYRAALEAALLLPRFMPMFMSAAGTIRPAKVLVLGAGVAGLQVVAMVRKLGAVVEVFDVRSSVKEEVMSLGGRFVEVEGFKEDKGAGGYAVEQSEEFKARQRELIHERASGSDIIITTAQIPGKKAPILITKRTVEAMKPGSVIIDLAASSGGNCELTPETGELLLNGVTIAARSYYAANMPVDASKMFGNNFYNLLKSYISEEGHFNLDMDDEIIKAACVIHDGLFISERLKKMYNI